MMAFNLIILAKKTFAYISAYEVLGKEHNVYMHQYRESSYTTKTYSVNTPHLCMDVATQLQLYVTRHMEYL